MPNSLPAEQQEELEELEKRVPEPAMIRAAVVAVAGLASVILKHEVRVDWLDPILNIYPVITPLILGWLIRAKVTPVLSKGKHAKE